MTDIPYNYKKYIDDVTKMRQRGTISAGEQVASPSSAGSRGLAKLTDFTNKPNELMKANMTESMRNIIDMINEEPTNEASERDILLNKIKLGLKKFRDKDIFIRSFFAPNHTYDLNTLKALKNSGIEIVIDGYGLFPYQKFDLLFIPQLFYREIFLPFGIQSTQIHLNYWNDKYFSNFENFINKNHSKIVNLDYILNLKKSNFLKNTINYSVEKTLKAIRFFR